MPVRRHDADGVDPVADPARVDRLGPVRGELVRVGDEDDVERAVDVDAEAPAAPEVRDGPAPDLGQPARQGVVAEVVGHGRQRLGRRGDRDGVGREAVVRERLAVGGPRGTDQFAPVAPGRERDRAGAQDDQPVRPLGADELPEAPAERCIVERPADDPGIGRARGGEPEPVPFGEPRPGRPDPALESGRRSRRAPGGGCGRRRVASSESSRHQGGDRGRSSGPRVHRPRRQHRRRRGDAGRGGDRARDPPRGAAARCLAALRHGTLGRARPARLPQRRGRARRTRQSRPGVRGDPAPGPAQGPGARLRASAGPRWGPRALDLDLLVFGRARLSPRTATGSALGRCGRRSRPGRPAARGPASRRRAAAVRARAAGRSRAGARAAGLVRDRGDRATPASRGGWSRHGAGRRDVGRGGRTVAVPTGGR